MASAWGNSWGNSWNGAWGSIGTGTKIYGVAVHARQKKRNEQIIAIIKELAPEVIKRFRGSK